MFFKKFTNILITFVFSISILFYSPFQAFAVDDTTPPTLVSITVDKASATIGDNVNITITATDDGSGLAERVNGKGIIPPQANPSISI